LNKKIIPFHKLFKNSGVENGQMKKEVRGMLKQFYRFLTAIIKESISSKYSEKI
jgi:hypothetical protein